MLRWITKPIFSAGELVWAIWFALAWHDHEWFAAAVCCILGPCMSAFLTCYAKRHARPNA